MTTPRPCLDCGTPTTGGPRCPPCTHTHALPRRTRKQQLYGGNWRTISRQTIADHIATHGPICPGYQQPPHPAPIDDLTTDHVQPGNPSQLQVLCRSCNSRKAARPR